MLVPTTIIIDENGPEDGADIKPSCVVVKKENLDRLMEGFRLFMPGINFQIFTKEEYEASEKKKDLDSNTPE